MAQKPDSLFLEKGLFSKKFGNILAGWWFTFAFLVWGPFILIAIWFFIVLGEGIVWLFSFGYYLPTLMYNYPYIEMFSCIWSENTLFLIAWIGVIVGLIFAKLNMLENGKKIPIVGRILK